MAMQQTRRPLAALALAAVVGAVVLAPVSDAEGPGYGATADELALSWETGPAVVAAGPSTSPGPGLRVQGVGFRAGVPAEIRLGAGAVEEVTADPSGTLETVLPSSSTVGQPGTAVIADGVTPSGSRRVLVGTVPPLPDGRGPSDLVPLAVGLVVALGVLRSALRRRGVRSG
jgi:hypothetical protein